MMRLLKILTFILCLSSTLSCIYDGPVTKEDIKVGDIIPDFSVEMYDGTTMTGEYLRKGVSVIMFFHTGCPDCAATLPEVQKIYDEYSSIDKLKEKLKAQPYTTLTRISRIGFKTADSIVLQLQKENIIDYYKKGKSNFIVINPCYYARFYTPKYMYLLDYAFNFLRLRMIYAIIGVNNKNCSHIYQSLGFQPSSTLLAWTLEDNAILWQKINPS